VNRDAVAPAVGRPSLHPMGSPMPAHSNTHASPPTRIGFNGELHEPNTGWQLLGNGYRAYSPVLMRFHGPDSLSPFDQGDMNTYGYCKGEPINYTDPSGHVMIPLMAMTLLGTGLVAASFAVSDNAIKWGVRVIGAALLTIAGGRMVGIMGHRMMGGHSISQVPQAIGARIGKVRTDLHQFTRKMKLTTEVGLGIKPFPYFSNQVYKRLLPSRRVQQAYGGNPSMAVPRGGAPVNRPRTDARATGFPGNPTLWTATPSFLRPRNARVGRAQEENLRVRDLISRMSP
jgi:RHS repeat-associated protein